MGPQTGDHEDMPGEIDFSTGIRGKFFEPGARPSLPMVPEADVRNHLERKKMDSFVFEHVPVADLPEKWRAKLAKAGDALVTVRIEAEAQAPSDDEFIVNDPLFGMWRDREDMAIVADYVRKLRASRFNDGGTRPSDD